MNIKIQFAIFLTLPIFLLSCCTSPKPQLSNASKDYPKSCCVNNTDPAALRILCFGDSITQGIGAIFQGGYRGPLKKLFGQVGLETDFVGSSGIGSASPNLPDPEHEGNGGRRLSQMTNTIITEIFAKNRDLDIVIILIGINDLIENRNTVDMTISRMSDLLDLAAQNAPAAKIYVGNLIPNAADDPVDQYDPKGKHVCSEDKVVKFNKILPSVVNEKKLKALKIELVDLHSRLSYYDLDDGIHPNVQGYNKIAQAWFEAITAE